ncbi:hypothetical protein RR46_03415 [Papilio xuthus]|uniref:Uncharacterized protein n=1 Tax=Papilio xuthus TaxID=66420 RepID=A0A194QAW9_PAPXU|nr:hypothetical protein RR46_03415 [Papilio xuthus]
MNKNRLFFYTDQDRALKTSSHQRTAQWSVQPPPGGVLRPATAHHRSPHLTTARNTPDRPPLKKFTFPTGPDGG